jgi:hypothetical protein
MDLGLPNGNRSGNTNGNRSGNRSGKKQKNREREAGSRERGENRLISSTRQLLNPSIG